MNVTATATADKPLLQRRPRRAVVFPKQRY